MSQIKLTQVFQKKSEVKKASPREIFFGPPNLKILSPSLLNGIFPWRNCYISPNKNIAPTDWKNSIYFLRWNTAFNKENNFCPKSSKCKQQYFSEVIQLFYNNGDNFFSVVYCQINFLSRVRDTFSEYFLHKLMM